MRAYLQREGHRPRGGWQSSITWMPIAWCLHMLTMATLLAFLLTACGGTSQPWGYVWTDTQHFETLTWNAQNGQLSGQYSGISYAQVSFPSTTQPDSYGAAYTGTLKGQAVTITLGSGLLSENLMGTQSGDDSTLTLTFLDPTSTKPVQQRWIAVTALQQSQLVQAFDAYQTARGWLGEVQRQVQIESSWRDPNVGSLANTQAALQQQQAQLAAMQQAQDMETRCALVAHYLPLNSSWFALPFSTHNDELLSALAHFQQAWQAAERSSVPHIAGLALPWPLSPQDERRAIAPATALATRIQIAYAADVQTMKHYQQQSKLLDEQVTTLSQGCPPLPS
jgi:hypothetical protein